jgi:two-component system OmpR family sensor kinase
MKGWWALTPLPAAAGLAVAILAWQGAIANPVLYLRGRLGLCALVAGLVLSLLAAAFLGLAEGLKAHGRRAARQLDERAARERTRFLRRLDHELKNPLTALRNQLTKELDNSPTPEQRAGLAALEVQVLRLGRLTEDLRSLADLETHPLRTVSIDVDELLQESEALVENLPGAGERTWQWLVPRVPAPPTFPGDWNLVLQAVCNLLTNAIKFTRPGDRIEVRVAELGEWVTIEVADTGPGISREELVHLGEELFRGADARAREVPGSGLGLALVRSIAARHGGEWKFDSQEGVGTTVTLRFPRVARA